MLPAASAAMAGRSSSGQRAVGGTDDEGDAVGIAIYHCAVPGRGQWFRDGRLDRLHPIVELAAHRARCFWPTAWVSSAYVKPYVKRNKNDAADAEAVSRPCAAPYERPWG